MNEILKLIEHLADDRIVKALLFAGAAFTTLFQVIKDGPEFFKRRVRIPVWVIMLCAVVAYWLFGHVRPPDVSLLEPKDFKVYKGEVFGRQTIDIAGKRFLRCDFNGTTLVITGLNDSEIAYSNLTNGTNFSFSGPAIRTLHTLTTLYQTPGTRAVMDTLFEDIKKGTIPKSPPINNVIDN